MYVYSFYVIWVSFSCVERGKFMSFLIAEYVLVGVTSSCRPAIFFWVIPRYV